MFQPGKIWLDTTDKPIQAHGGAVLYDQGTYYWFGENKAGPTLPGYHVDIVGISCYSSRDLYHWQHEGVVLPTVPDDPSHDLHPSRVAERPKVIYNAQNHTYVMWLHIDKQDYTYARTGVAVSSTATGPYHYMGSFRPCDFDSRDMTLFQDDDGSAYVLFSSEYNRNITIAQLTDDYLHTSDVFIKTLSHAYKHSGREAPAVFKRHGHYYLLTSGCTGWDPNAAEYATSTSMLGNWQTQGNPCVGKDADKTFYAQSTFVLPVANKTDAFIFMADLWKPGNLRESLYAWLPIIFIDDRPVIAWHDQWDLSTFDS